MLQLKVLGSLKVARDGKPVSLPRSKKTRALLAYLAVTGQRYRRDRLCEVLWDVPDDPRAALRWSLSKIRPVVNETGCERIIADREHVSFGAEGMETDLNIVKDALAADPVSLPPEQLAELAELFRGKFLEGLDLPAQPAFQAWCVAEREEARQYHRQILRELISRLKERPLEALPYARALVEIDPLNDEARGRLIKLLTAAGHREEAVQHYQIGQRLLDEIDAGPSQALEEARRAAIQGTPPKAAPEEAVPRLRPSDQQDIRFCRAADGVRIAYATSGRGPPLVKTANWLNHLEHDWESPVWRHLFRALSKHWTLVRYDERGNGLSDWDVEALSFDAMVEDLETVVDDLGLEKFPMLGISQGCAVSIAYAVRHPERVSHLVLVGGYLQGWRSLGDPRVLELREAQMTLIQTGWGRNNPAFRQMFSSLYIPGGTAEQLAFFTELQRISTSPENASRLLEVLGDIDVRALAPKVKAPTLVMHSRSDAVVPFACSRDIAAAIPGAKFVALESDNHLVMEHEPAWQRYIEELLRFLGQDA